MSSLVLASTSPFRRALLTQAGLVFETAAATIDERAIGAPLEESAMPPDGIAQRLADEKALDVSRRSPGALVIGADQTLSVGSDILHKPDGREGALRTLRRLSGQTHRLNSAVALAQDGAVLWRHVSLADLTMRPLGEDFIARYLDRVGPRVFASVGAYQLEAEGVQLFERIEGDYFTIIGLPMLPLLAKLRELRVIDA
ncbi:Maf-like protein [Ensifer soli]|uniref:Maf-like protein n=1 Tax=Ciceribacter sp. sgz301302 TaxID=3342379 RepID=UPI0035B80A24